MAEKNLIIALSLEEGLLSPLYQWGERFNWSDISNVHFVHIVKKNITPLEFGLMELPSDDTFSSMKPTLKVFLEEEASKIVPKTFKGKITTHLALDFNPPEVVVNLIKELNASLLVLSTRGKHGFEGLFHSSFTDHMVRFAPCDVYVVRPKMTP
jgi:nucleotide-binding universal stress UspA family protein